MFKKKTKYNWNSECKSLHYICTWNFNFNSPLLFFFDLADRESFPNTQLLVPAVDARKLKNESVNTFVQFAFDFLKKIT